MTMITHPLEQNYMHALFKTNMVQFDIVPIQLIMYIMCLCPAIPITICGAVCLLIQKNSINACLV